MGTIRFEVVLSQELEVLTILKPDGGGQICHPKESKVEEGAISFTPS